MKPKVIFVIAAVVAASLIAGGHAYANSISSQGVYVIESNVVNDVGYTGQGIKVAVIDSGFNITDAEIASNIVETRSFPANYDIAASGNTGHGTSTAQIVVDVAPDVELHLYNFRSTTHDFPDLVDYIINRTDIDIVTLSMSIFNTGHYDGTSPPSQKVREAVDSGIVWIKSAGNHAQRHWSGTFVDANSNGFHDFGTDESIGLPVAANSIVRLELTWDDPWRASNNDYDLFLYDGNGNEVARSVQEQNGNDMPLETIRFNVASNDVYDIKINRTSGDAKDLKLFVRGATFSEHRVAAGSITIPGDSEGAITVAAMQYDTEALQSYSSRGPTDDGRTKPDISGPSHVTTSVYENFRGTSAAAPHVAGIAALIKEANPYYTPAQVRDALEQNTKGHHPKDNDSGTGLANAVNSMEFAFVDTFGSDLSQWTESGEPDWNVEPESEKNVPNHNATTNEVAHADNCDTSCIIRTAAIDLSEYLTANLYFWRYVDSEIDRGEYLRVDVSSNNGSSWNSLSSWTDPDGDDDTWRAGTYKLDQSYLTENFAVQFTARASTPNEALEIDDVVVFGDRPATIFSESFDNFDLWTESGEPDWRVTSNPPDGAGHPPGAASGNNVAVASDCDSECVLTLDTPVDLTVLESANLILYRYVDNSLDAREYLKIDASQDNGTSWSTLFEWTHNDGDDDTWREESVELSADYMSSSEFKVRAVAKMNSASEEVMIDDIAISGPLKDSAGSGPPTAYSVYLADTDDREVLVFSQNGTYIDNFVSYRSNGLGKAWDVAFGPDGHLYISDYTYKKIRQYNGMTGASIGTSAGWASTTGYPYGLTWNDDKLYVATSQGVEVFDSAGASQGLFGDASRNPSTAGAPTLSSARDVAFCPDGKMYVADQWYNRILYYTANNGTYTDKIDVTSFLDLRQPTGLVCGAASGVGTGETSIYQSGATSNRINEIDATRYSRVHTVTSLVDGPYGIDIDGSQILYVANKDDDNILKINGTQSSVFATTRSVDDPRGVTLGPVYSGGASGSTGGASGSTEGTSSAAPGGNDEPEFTITHDGQELREPLLLSSVVKFLVSAVDPDGDSITISIVEDAEPALTAAGALSILDFGNGTAIVTANATGVASGTYMPMIRVADTQDNYDDGLLPIIVP